MEDITRAQFAKNYVGDLTKVLTSLPWADIERCLAALEHAYDNNKQVFIVGNGGSAATASHMANDLMLGVAKDGAPGFRVISLTDNVACMTAIGNDESYEHIFEGQLRTLAQPDDLLIVITGSGNSPNVVRAARFAKGKNLKVIGFLGKDGGAMKALCDAHVIVPSDDYGPIEDAHMMLDHLTTRYFRDRLRKRSK